MRGYTTKERILGYVLEDRAASSGDQIFLDFKGEEFVSYRQLNEQANQFGNGLRELGVEKNTKVGIMLPNCPDYLYSWFGIGKIGAVMVPINTAYRGDLLQYIISQSDTEVLIIAESYLDRLALVEPGLTGLKRVLVRTDLVKVDSARPKLKIPTMSLTTLHQASSDPPDVPVKHSDPLAILFTSGTTGPSKGAVMSHHFYLYFGDVFKRCLDYGPDDVLYTCLPLFHVNAQNATILCALLADARVALHESFHASTFWDEIRRSQATAFNGLGAMGNILLNQPPSPRDRDHRVRVALIVPAPDHLEEFESRFNLRVCYEVHGMTECMIIPPSFSTERRKGCCGKAPADFELKLVDDDDIEVPVGMPGELIVRPKYPYTCFSGYYKMPEETVNAFRNLWFHTGDRLRMDGDGYFYFVDRKKESIRRRGENISSFEIEKVVNQHPEVVETAAIPVPSELGEDEVKIVVVLRPGSSLTPEQLIQYCEERMAYFMVPRYVEFRDILPKTPSQKTEKYKLQQEGITLETWDREKAGYKLKR